MAGRVKDRAVPRPMGDPHPALTAAAEVDEARLWQRHLDLARCGGTEAGGVNRPALSAADAEARRLMVTWGRSLDLTPTTDAIGNLFLRREGRDPSLAPVLTGSHLDSQPMGGKFDGAFGVLAGLEALEAMTRADIVTRRPVEVVAWVNEEGGRFQPGTMGSGVFSGQMDISALLAVADRAGTTVAEALEQFLASTPGLPTNASQFPPAAFLEAHIEQGPLLERENLTVGVVTHVQGLRWFTVEVVGEAAHAGTTPESLRHDAFMAAHDIIATLSRQLAGSDDRLRFTVGRFDVEPGTPSTIPARVFFTIDLRHPEQERLDRLTETIEEVCAIAPRGCTVSLAQTEDLPPTAFHPQVTEVLSHWSARLQLPHTAMMSGAAHDAMHLARICPSGMIFVPCRGGISHNEAEYAKAADLAAGTRLLTAALVDLADR